MFATKKCLLAWFKYYLNKINGVYVCPVTGDIAYPRRVRGGWCITGWPEERLWDIEDVKDNQKTNT